MSMPSITSLSRCFPAHVFSARETCSKSRASIRTFLIACLSQCTYFPLQETENTASTYQGNTEKHKQLCLLNFEIPLPTERVCFHSATVLKLAPKPWRLLIRWLSFEIKPISGSGADVHVILKCLLLCSV